jgi:hypothetical protein
MLQVLTFREYKETTEETKKRNKLRELFIYFELLILCDNGIINN